MCSTKSTMAIKKEEVMLPDLVHSSSLESVSSQLVSYTLCPLVRTKAFCQTLPIMEPRLPYHTIVKTEPMDEEVVRANFLSTINEPDCSIPGASSYVCDALAVDHQNPINHVHLPFMKLAPTGTIEHQVQFEMLMYPRVCVDWDREIVDRFVTDSVRKSGRCYDRLEKMEVPRVVPMGAGYAPRTIYDVLSGRIRKRELMDDFKVPSVEGAKGLEVSQEEVRCWFGMDDRDYPMESIERDEDEATEEYDDSEMEEYDEKGIEV